MQIDNDLHSYTIKSNIFLFLFRRTKVQRWDLMF